MNISTWVFRGAIKNVDIALNDFKKHSFSEALCYFNTGQFNSIEKLKHYYNNVSSPLQTLEKNIAAQSN